MFDIIIDKIIAFTKCKLIMQVYMFFGIISSMKHMNRLTNIVARPLVIIPIKVCTLVCINRFILLSSIFKDFKYLLEPANKDIQAI